MSDKIRGMKSAAIALLVMGIAVMIGGILSLIRLIESCTNGFNGLNFALNLMAIICYASIIVYGFYSYKKGYYLFYVILGIFAAFLIIQGFIFKIPTQDNQVVNVSLITMTALSYGGIVATLFSFKKRDRVLIIMPVVICLEIAIAIVTCCFISIPEGTKDFQVVLSYLNCFTRPLLATCIFTGYIFMGAKKKIEQ